MEGLTDMAPVYFEDISESMGGDKLWISVVRGGDTYRVNLDDAEVLDSAGDEVDDDIAEDIFNLALEYAESLK